MVMMHSFRHFKCLSRLHGRILHQQRSARSLLSEVSLCKFGGVTNQRQILASNHISCKGFSTCMQFLSDHPGDNNQQGEADTDAGISPEEEEEFQKLIDNAYIVPSSGHRIFVVQPDFKKLRRETLTSPQLQLDEACALAESLPYWKVHGKGIYTLKHLDKNHVFTKGIFEDLTDQIGHSREITAVFVSIDMLTAHQISQLQRKWGMPVYDRYTVVLQIFKTRAQTKEAKLQVALAELPYLRTRLRGLNAGSSGQNTGGLSAVGGSGETWIETRFRILQTREKKINYALRRLASQRSILKKNRKRQQLPTVAVVGYTNAGKTSLIKALTGDVSMKPVNRVFATLDVTTHAGFLQNNMKVLYIDTVGFISDIPTELIASFSATLEDMLDADVICHVRDISHPDTESQKHNVMQTLENLRLPVRLRDNLIEVGNKVDLLQSPSSKDSNCIMVSAETKAGLGVLMDRVQETLLKTTGRVRKRLKVPMSGSHIAWLYKEASVENSSPCDDDPECALVDVVFTPEQYAKFQAQYGNKKAK